MGFWLASHSGHRKGGTHRPDVVFNLCEAPLGRADLEAYVAALFEWEGVPATADRLETGSVFREKQWVEGGCNAPFVHVSENLPVPCFSL